MAESLQQNAGNDVCRSVDDELSLMSLMTFSASCVKFYNRQ